MRRSGESIATEDEAAGPDPAPQAPPQAGVWVEAFLDEPCQATMSQLETTEERLAEIADERIANQQEAQNWWEKFKGNLVGNPVESVVDGFDAITDRSST